jgi:hypothetical protein
MSLYVGQVVLTASVFVVATSFSSCGLIVAFRGPFMGPFCSWFSCCLMCISLHFDFVLFLWVCICVFLYCVFGQIHALGDPAAVDVFVCSLEFFLCVIFQKWCFCCCPFDARAVDHLCFDSVAVSAVLVVALYFCYCIT